ncbi:alcohol dehydrogenase catalytic domain-containing protein [Tunturiibacter empetritectus]|uniref:S-(Hydroxymethyl)glutathione dehydrogenase/alcohol dehydrogenase n=1 Tax=Tunturiibacter lichenicola TaxID=2051959 RepID=A0A852VLT8_9BACT|nr:alcohol dehydrogenase catalytic domain-containing protein [Edaphobacter lichenicola]NYF92259.1 S-(hydroxymethyl)glutathione dehydrogenase/alcohol dehydrogenase [Edaphobacter lichenicola]
MPTQAQAIVTDGRGHFALEDVTLDDPERNEVLVKIRASGVCHTDFDSMSWGRRIILGHEGAGIVVATGPDVTRVSPGDRVLLNWAIPCGQCFQCRRGAENICEEQPVVPDARYGGNLNSSFHLGTMSTHAIVPSQAVVPINVSIPFPQAAILGCCVMTGFGSVINVARVPEGDSVVVLGCGGVGLSVILGAVHARAAKIIAVDLNSNRLELARRIGATDTVQSLREDTGLLEAAARVRTLTGRGADFAFECTAVPALGAAPLAMVRNGGTAVAVSGIEEFVSIDMQLFEWDKIYINPLYGQCRPFADFPKLLSLYAAGFLKLDEMITRTYSLTELAEAFEHMHLGLNAKGVLLPYGA